MKKSTLSSVFVISILLITCPVYATWIANGGESGEGKDESGSLIIEGASNFLQSYSNILMLLNESELSSTSGFDFTIARSAVDTAAIKLKNSREKYSQALLLMKQAEYSSFFIQGLKDFHYDKFVEERHLNPCTMQHVSTYLSKGDVIGVYEKAIKDLDVLHAKLAIIRAFIHSNEVPGLEDLQTLYQHYSDFMAFGYYCSLVFYEVKK
jgi:hypothetical protein